MIRALAIAWLTAIGAAFVIGAWPVSGYLIAFIVFVLVTVLALYVVNPDVGDGW